jgi:hypothetical protein
MGPGDWLLSDYPENAGQGVFEASFRILAKDILPRRKEALHLGVALFYELDDGMCRSARKKLDDAPKRNVVSYDQVMEKSQRENEVCFPGAAVQE